MALDWNSIRQVDCKWLDSVWAEAKAELLYEVFRKSRSLDEWSRYLKDHPPSPTTLAICLMLGQEKYSSEKSRKAANAKHSKPGGTRDKAAQIRKIWASGKFSTRDLCAREECDSIGMSYDAARRALRNTPDNT